MHVLHLIILAVLSTSVDLFSAEIKKQPPTTEELASAMGIRSYCADLTLTDGTHPRLVAEVTDKEGKVVNYDVTPRGDPKEIYRVRIFLFQDVQTRVPTRVIFNLSADDNVAGNGFIDFPPGSRWSQTASSSIKDWFYRIKVFGIDAKKDVFEVKFRIETSKEPYPMPSSVINQPIFSTRQVSPSPP